MGVNFHDLGVVNGFLNMTPKAQQWQQQKMLNFIKI